MSTRRSTEGNASSPAEADSEVGKMVENIKGELQDDKINNQLVSWEGPGDAQNPKNWTFKKRWAVTGLVSLVTFMTPMSSSIIAPAGTIIAQDFKVTSTFVEQLNFSIILLAYVFGPIFLAPLCEIFGRVIVLQLANIFFLIFNFACSWATNESEFLAFRFLSGLGGCAPLTIGGGVISDLWKPEERGMAIGLYTLAPLLSPALGPLLGAWIAEKSMWQWCFWSVTIFGVIVQALVFFTLKETYAPRILENKAEKLRKETGDEAYHTVYELRQKHIYDVIQQSLGRVIRLLFTQPIVMVLALYFALVYGIIYLIISDFSDIWTEQYHESVGIGGLNYIALMIGLTVGAQTGGRLVDLGYRHLKARSATQTGEPEFRVPLLFVSTLLCSAGMFMYGWSAAYTVFWLVPDIGICIFGCGAAMTFTAIQTYIIDAYSLYAASAIGATAIVRSLTGFGFPLFAPAMYSALGYGWGNSVLGFAIAAIGYVGALTLWFFGKKLRDSSPYARGDETSR